MSRHCARPGCNQVATATLTYDYAARVAWLDRLHAEAHPMTHDMCDRHSERLSVPQGWRLEDRRGAAPSAVLGPRARDEVVQLRRAGLAS